MRLSIALLLAGLALAVVIFLVTGGKVVFLPLVLLVPFALFRFGRRD